MRWADLFQDCPKETKKMIVAYLIDSVHIRHWYEVDIKFNVEYEHFCKGNEFTNEIPSFSVHDEVTGEVRKWA
jgi:hypothetical protein